MSASRPPCVKELTVLLAPPVHSETLNPKPRPRNLLLGNGFFLETRLLVLHVVPAIILLWAQSVGQQRWVWRKRRKFAFLAISEAACTQRMPPTG